MGVSVGSGVSLVDRSSVLKQSGVAAPVTGTTAETTLATIPLPAGIMGLNGVLRITMVWTVTNSANNKSLRVVLGGSLFSGVDLTTTASAQFQVHIRNRGVANSQIGFISSSGFPFSTSGGSPVTGTVDTAVAQNLLITGQLASGAETITLEAYTVELLNP